MPATGRGRNDCLSILPDLEFSCREILSELRHVPCSSALQPVQWGCCRRGKLLRPMRQIGYCTKVTRPVQFAP